MSVYDVLWFVLWGGFGLVASMNGIPITNKWFWIILLWGNALSYVAQYL